MFILAFFVFLRCSELAISSKFDPATNPTISDLTILDSETISFLIKQSKTDQIKKGHFVYTSSIFLLSDVGESLPATHLKFLSLYLSNAASLDLPLDAGEVLPARQSYYSVFTCPTQRVLISRWTPARCSRPDNLTFFCLYLSNTASLDLPLDAGEVLPARQSYFLCLYLSNTASPGISLDGGEVLPARQSYFSCLYLSNTASLNLPLDAGEVLPARQSYFSCLYLSNTASLNLPLDAGEVLTGQTNALPSARTKNIEPRRTRHTWPFWQS